MFTLIAFIFHFSLWGASLPPDFIFGVANAPEQVEDKLDDIWLDWAKQGKISSWKETPSPNERLKFWTVPEVELNLAENLGVDAFRMGISWERVMPQEGEFDEAALSRYHEILKEVKKRNMKVMLTLWHHSVPKWIQAKGGWKNKETKKDFLKFSKKVIKEFNPYVDWWITFNEANVFVTMAYTIGIWPPGEKNFPLTSLKALDLMAETHNDLYDWAHENFNGIKIGLAHNMAYYSGKNFFNQITAYITDKIMNWRFPEKVRGRMDFFGFNYYGAEWLKGSQVDIDPKEEYSEAGRAVYPAGLYFILKDIHDRFPDLPVIITENGIADATDVLRPAYLIEHLKAVSKAIKEGVKVHGYFAWSLTDNLEWSDGYCPKFGFVSVNRKTFERTPRKSYYIFKEIIEKKKITKKLQEKVWKEVFSHRGKDRPFCRDADGITAFDKPVLRMFSAKDWRFNPQD